MRRLEPPEQKFKAGSEPEALKRGKAFHREVQLDWVATAEGSIHCERTISLIPIERTHRVRRGRMDLFVDGIGGMVVVVEIKGTDWDSVKNVPTLLSAHRRQVWRYVEKHLDMDKVDVCPGMIYPTPPKSDGLREQVESYLNEHGIQVVWFYD